MFTAPLRHLLATSRESAPSTERDDGARLVRGFRLPSGGQMLGLGAGAAALAGVAWYATDAVSQYQHRELASAIYQAHGMPELASGSSVRSFSESKVPGSNAVTFKIRYADGSEHKQSLVRRQSDAEALRTLQLNHVHVPATAANIVISEKAVAYTIGTLSQTQQLPDGFDANKKSKLERVGDRLDQARERFGGAKDKVKGWLRKDEQ